METLDVLLHADVERFQGEWTVLLSMPCGQIALHPDASDDDIVRVLTELIGSDVSPEHVRITRGKSIHIKARSDGCPLFTLRPIT